MGADAKDAPPPPEESSLQARNEVIKTIQAMGNMPFALAVFVPRLMLSSLVVGVAMMSRAIARVLDVTSSYARRRPTCAS